MQLVTGCLYSGDPVAIAENMDCLIAGATIAGVNVCVEPGNTRCCCSGLSIILARASDDNDTAGALNRIEKS